MKNLIGSKFKENNLYINKIKEEYKDDVMLQTTLHQQKSFFDSVKFMYVEVETKKKFLQAITKLNNRGEGFPQLDEEIQKTKNAIKERKKVRKEVKNKNKEEKENFLSQVQEVVKGYEEAKKLREQYENKMDDYEKFLNDNGSKLQEIKQQQPNGVYTVQQAEEIIQKQNEKKEQVLKDITNTQQIASELSSQVLQLEEQYQKLRQERQMSPYEKQQHLNEVLSFLTGITVKSIQTTDDKEEIVLQLKTSAKTDVLHTVRIVYEFDKKWSLKYVELSPKTVQYDDIVQYAIQHDDLEFLLRELQGRILFNATK